MSKEIKDHQEMERAEKNRFWQAHIETWKQSGINQSAYCRGKGLSLRSFGIEIGDGFNPETLRKLLETLAGGV